jgi:hypothetical protein
LEFRLKAELQTISSLLGVARDMNDSSEKVVGGRWSVVGEETKTDHRPPFHCFWVSHRDMYDSSENSFQFSVFSDHYSD